MKELKQKKGITLVALIITIIVLLILAVVAIGAITNEGIINHAKNARTEYEAAQTNEKYALSQLEEFLTEYQTGVTVEQVTDTAPGELEGVGTESEPYVINSIEDLVFFAYDVTNGNTYEGKYVNLGLNLDFNSTKSYVQAYRTDYGKYGYNGELKTLLTTGEGWIPIGSISDSETNLSFYGTFDGNNHTIYNLHINRSVESGESYQFYGLFAQNYGIIKNLTVRANIEISSTQINIHVGGISGYSLADATIENCTSNGTVDIEGCKSEGNCYAAAGGVVGMSRGTIVMCKNNATIIGDGVRVYLGGIVGSLHTGSAYKSYNVGKIVLENYYGRLERAGGIAGNFNRGNIINCFNLGEIIGDNMAGGIVGNLQGHSTVATIISNCVYNNSAIEGVGYYEMNGIPEEMVQVEISKNENLTEDEVLNILNNIE